jgi:hypothetical protein
METQDQNEAKQEEKQEPKELAVNGNVSLSGEIPPDFSLTPCCEVSRSLSYLALVERSEGSESQTSTPCS